MAVKSLLEISLTCPRFILISIYKSVSFDIDISWSWTYLEEILSLEITESCESRWKSTENKIDDLIPLTYTEMAKNSVEYTAKLNFPKVMWLKCLEILQMP